MSHRVLVMALSFVAERRAWYSCVDSTVGVAVLTTQRQILNCLAPVLPRHGELVPVAGCKPYFRLLMRADTFRFTTVLHAYFRLSAALVCEILVRISDFVIRVELHGRLNPEVIDALGALPHLEEVDVSVLDPVSYHEHVRPLLKHPRESVRRSVARALFCGNLGHLLFRDLPKDPHSDLFDVFKDDFIPLIDNASCIGALEDYLGMILVTADDETVFGGSWRLMPRDVVLMLCGRAYSFALSARSTQAVVALALEIFAAVEEAILRLNSGAAVEDTDEKPIRIDLYNDWPLVEELPRLIARHPSLPATSRSLVNYLRGAFCGSRNVLSQRVFELQLLDVIYDSCLARKGRSPFSVMHNRDVFAQVARHSPIQFLTKTSVWRNELQNFLLPWHREAMAIVQQFKAQGKNVVDPASGAIMLPSCLPDTSRLGAAEILVVLAVSHRQDQQVLKVLFDEGEGFNLVPVLQSLILMRCSYVNVTSMNVLLKDLFIQRQQQQAAEQQDPSRRRDRDGDDCKPRGYLAELLDNEDVREVIGSLTRQWRT